MTHTPSPRARARTRPAARRGVASVLAMMFLVIFGSLAAAMAVVAQGNLSTADTHLKIGRSLTAADTGMRFIQHHLDAVALQVETSLGVIDDDAAGRMWNGDASTGEDGVARRLVNALALNAHNVAEPYFQTIQDGLGNTTFEVVVQDIAVGPGEPRFTATLTPHPLVDDVTGGMIDYDAPEYDRPPFDGSQPATGIDWDVSNARPLDARFVRVTVTAHDGPTHSRVFRSIAMDLNISKKIRFALLSRSRVMIGQNVMVLGPIGSTFGGAEPDELLLENGHPIQMVSDFGGLHPDLDAALEALNGDLVLTDLDGDNRLNVNNPSEVENFSDPQSLDLNQDGYIDDYDMFLAVFASGSDKSSVSKADLDAKVDSSNPAAVGAANELFTLIDTFNPDRNLDGIDGDDPDAADASLDGDLGYNDGVIDDRDRYMKVRGEVTISAEQSEWEAGLAANGDGTSYHDHFRGPIDPSFNGDAVTFGDGANERYRFDPADFDTSSYNTGLSVLLTSGVTEHELEPVPYGAENTAYDYYNRPVYRDQTFWDIFIPMGTNALFINCTFIGTTFVQTYADNTHPDWNYAGMLLADGVTPRHPDRSVPIDGTDEPSTKPFSNNIRFHNCTFEGSIVTSTPSEYTHVRNKLTFTGPDTDFIDLNDPEEVVHLDEADRLLYARSSILAPHFSVEIGAVAANVSVPSEKIDLSGTLVSGLIDMRGNIDVHGTILTTFEPQSDTGPVIGDTSPNFNTTLGYFTEADGDLEVDALPTDGLGRITLRYDPTRPLPDGIQGPIEVRPIVGTYREGGGP